MIRLLLVFISILSTCENCLKRLHRKEILSSFLQLLIQIQNILVVFFNFSTTRVVDYSLTFEFCRL